MSASRRPKKTLTTKQRKFLEEYPKDGNATQAAIRAGYKANRAKEMGYRMVKMMRLRQQEVDLQVDHMSQADRDLADFAVLLRRGMFYDTRKLFDNHGNCVEIADLPEEMIPAVTGYEVTEEYSGRGESREKIGYTRKIKLADRTTYMNIFARIKGLYRNDELPQSPLEQEATALLLAMRQAILNRAANRKALVNAKDDDVFNTRIGGAT